MAALDVELVQIGSKRKPASTVEKILAGPIADKFFSIGVFASLLGIGWLGTHLWLILNGQIQGALSYAWMKQAHIVLQFHLFFGAFVLGFVCQASAKLLGVKERPPAKLLILLLPLCLGGIWLISNPESIGGAILLSAAYGGALCYLLRIGMRRDGDINQHARFFFIASMLGFLVSPFLDLQLASQAIIVFWFTLAPALFSAGEQFICNFLGGTRCEGARGFALRVAYAVSFASGTAYLFHPAEIFLFSIWSFTVPLILGLYIYASSIWKAFYALRDTPLALAFLTGYFWAMWGALSLIVHGISWADLAFHVWATGWAVTIVIAVSCQIMGFLSGSTLVSAKILISGLLVWQLVPFGRGAFHIFPVGREFSWIVTTAAAVVGVYWMFVVLRAEYRILSRQLQLAKNEQLKSC